MVGMIMVDRNGRNMEFVVSILSQVAQPGKRRSRRWRVYIKNRRSEEWPLKLMTEELGGGVLFK